MRNEEKKRKGQGLRLCPLLFERGITSMSATKRQQAKRQSVKDWVAEMIGDYDYHTAITNEFRLETLEQEAGKANINLNSASEQMFRVSPHQLNNSQAQQLLAMLCEASAKLRKPVHSHRCVECGGTIPCFEQGACTTTEGECRSCHEGFRPGEWNAYERKLAQKGLL
jgi:hypothetical protein